MAARGYPLKPVANTVKPGVPNPGGKTVMWGWYLIARIYYLLLH